MKYSFIPAMVYITLTSCNHPDKKEGDIPAIRSLLEQERKAHFNKDADLFLSEFDAGMISVNKGVVSQFSKEEDKKKTQAYFNSAKFIKWDDVAEPIIKFSDDHSLAYAIIQKLVVLERKDSTGKTIMDTTNFAWTSIYRKQQNKWKLECNISTNK